MLDVVEKHVAMWKKSRLSPLLRELAVSVIRRAAQGMDDRLIWMYLDHRMRGLDPESAEWQAVYNTKMALVREDSRLSQSVREIREELERIEREREEAETEVPPEAQKLVIGAGAQWAWRDELRYKNSLIPPGARGGGRTGRRRKKEPKRAQIRRAYIDAVMRRHDEAMRRRKAKGVM